jgi:N-acetylmuramoyl-L-alanine amidase
MRVCIDPGHGMGNKQRGLYDPGATHKENDSTYKEAEIVLQYGLALKDAFRFRNTEVFMTRDDSNDETPLVKRAWMAKNADCDCLISLHVNDAEVEEANGLEIFYGAKSHAPFAKKMQERLLKILQIRDRSFKLGNNLAVLKFDGPAILIELGFIRFDSDREKILDQSMRFAVCRGIAEVTLEYFK